MLFRSVLFLFFLQTRVLNTFWFLYYVPASFDILLIEYVLTIIMLPISGGVNVDSELQSGCL